MTTKKKDLVQLGVLMTPKQIKMIDQAAKKIGLSRSAYVRHILFTYLLEK
jgi:ACT domain-containing protein